VSLLVTDAEPPAALRQTIAAAGTEIVVAGVAAQNEPA
jgi:hypothetical protein